MRQSARALVLVVLALVASAILGVSSAFMAALAVGATALIVPGTGTPSANIVEKYMEHAADRYIAPFTGSACTSTNGCNLDGIDYPASFWPLGFIGNWCPGYQCDRWDVSVGDGVESLDTAPIRNPEPNADDKDADEIKAGDETNADETRSDTGKKGDTGKQPEETKADTDTKPHTDKKAETDKDPEADNKDADSEKTAA